MTMSDYQVSKTGVGTGRLLQWSRSLVLGTAVVITLPVVSVATAPLIGESDAGRAFAQDDKGKKRDTRRTPAIRGQVFEKLSKAQEAAEAKNFQEAIKQLDELRDKTGRGELNSYELANLYNLYAFIYFSQENYQKALESYQNVVKQEDIPVAMEMNTKYTIAQLHFVMENWRKGIDMLLEWFRFKEANDEKPGANAHALLSQGYYQLKDYRKSLEHIEIAINDYQSKGKIPKEQWWGLQRYLYFEKGNIPKVVEILEETLKYYQKKAYWLQLASMYGEQKKETKMAATMDTAYVQGMLDREKELINMAYLYLSQDVPYYAGKVIDTGIEKELIEPTSKNLELLGNSWQSARETKKAIPAMRQAAAKSDEGELWTRLANIYLDNEEFDKAADAVRNGLKKGGLKRPGNAWLVLGMAEFNLEDYDAARKAFKEAQKSKDAKKYAKSWLEYLERELQRQQALREEEKPQEAVRAPDLRT